MERIENLIIGSKIRNRCIRDKIRWAKHRINTDQIVYCKVYNSKDKNYAIDFFRLGDIELLKSGVLITTRFSKLSPLMKYFGIKPMAYHWEQIELVSTKVDVELQLKCLLIIFSYIRKY